MSVPLWPERSARMQRTGGTPAIAYATRGTQGPRVLMVMGLGMRGEMWEPQLTLLEPTHRLAYFDHRGIGESGTPTRRYRIADLALDACAVADALGWATFHLVGVSMGGMVAQELALAAPARIRSLTLIVTHAGGPLGMVPTAAGALGAVRSALARDRIGALEQLLYSADSLEALRARGLRRRLEMQLTGAMTKGARLRQLWAVARFDTRRRLARLQVPTQILKASRDRLVRPSHSELLARQIPGAELRTFERAGHGVIVQESDAIAAAIREHIARHE